MAVETAPNPTAYDSTQDYNALQNPHALRSIDPGQEGWGPTTEIDTNLKPTDELLPVVAPETNPTEQVGRHRVAGNTAPDYSATEVVNKYRSEHAAFIDRYHTEAGPRNPDRFITRMGLKIGQFAERMAERRTVKQTIAETTRKGLDIATKVGGSIMKEVKLLGADTKANAKEIGGTVKTIKNESVEAVKSRWQKRAEAAQERRQTRRQQRDQARAELRDLTQQRKEASRAVWQKRREIAGQKLETVNKAAKTVGKSALIGAGVVVGLPIAAAAVGTYYGVKGGVALDAKLANLDGKAIRGGVALDAKLAQLDSKVIGKGLDLDAAVSRWVASKGRKAVSYAGTTAKVNKAAYHYVMSGRHERKAAEHRGKLN